MYMYVDQLDSDQTLIPLPSGFRLFLF